MRKMKLKDQMGINYVPSEVIKKAQDKKKKEEAKVAEYSKIIKQQKQNAVKIAQDKKNAGSSMIKSSTSVIGKTMVKAMGKAMKPLQKKK